MKPDQQLLENIKANLPQLQKLLIQCNNEWSYEDGIYRFYHQSFKVYRLQAHTIEIVEELQRLIPDTKLDEWFTKIITEGTGRVFKHDHNAKWLEITRPILEAFFHAKYFLEMAVKYSEMERAPNVLPSGWAALLSLYRMR